MRIGAALRDDCPAGIQEAVEEVACAARAAEADDVEAALEEEVDEQAWHWLLQEAMY